MQQINCDTFVKKYLGELNKVNILLKDKAIADLRILLAFMNADSKISSVQDASYMLATVEHECGRTFTPIEEEGKGRGRPYGKTCDNGQVMYGRGYVQLTWDYNYKRIGKLIGQDLYNNPSLCLHYDVAYKIMSEGMRNGWFTGVGLSRYIKQGQVNYKSARKIINGLDKADLIASYAVRFERIFQESFIG